MDVCMDMDAPLILQDSRGVFSPLYHITVCKYSLKCTSHFSLLHSFPLLSSLQTSKLPIDVLNKTDYNCFTFIIFRQ